jgi:hypothetical protein
MTDVLDRRLLDEIDADLAALDQDATVASPDVSLLGRAALAAVLVGAAVIHLVMVPSHLDEWAAEGIAFAAAGWVQLALAAVVFGRPTRLALWSVAAVNTVFVAAWAWTRIWGSPWGPSAGVAESAGFVDVTCAVLEMAAVAGALLLLARPTIGTAVGGRRSWVAALVPIVVLGTATAAIASPSARNHAHGDDGHAAGAAHAHDDALGELPAGHDHAAGDDKGLGMLSNGHHGDMTPVELDPLTQAKLDGQLAATREVVATYPTLADAMAAGYTRQGPFSPGLGIHYGRYNNFNADGEMSREDLLNPMTIIYDGVEPTAKIAGFMYYSYSEAEPEGFIGPNDHWHYHTNTCIKPAADGIDAPLGADQSVTAAQCEAVGGSLLPKTGWMVHVWTVPEYPMTDEHGGVFGEVNPALTCPDGTYYIRPMEEWAANPLSVCKSA